MISFMSHPQIACFGGRTGAEIESHFWSMVDRSSDSTGCWPWLASRYKDGYGQFKVDCKSVRAHRFAYALVNGPIPSTLYVCHQCDNRKCCNPAHLFMGTPADNTADMIKKGRHGRAKLTLDQVREIREASGTQEEIALRFGINRSNVGHIKCGRTWKQVKS